MRITTGGRRRGACEDDAGGVEGAGGGLSGGLSVAVDGAALWQLSMGLHLLLTGPVHT